MATIIHVIIFCFTHVMSDTALLCNKIYYTYLGSIMVPKPYLLAFWFKTLALAFKIADTDL